MVTVLNSTTLGNSNMAKLNVLKSLFIWKENDILKAVMLKVYVKIF